MFPQGEFLFRKLKPKRPTVIRKGDRVKTCYYYANTKRCLGPLCFWPKVGVCPFFNRLKPRFRAK